MNHHEKRLLSIDFKHFFEYFLARGLYQKAVSTFLIKPLFSNNLCSLLSPSTDKRTSFPTSFCITFSFKYKILADSSCWLLVSSHKHDFKPFSAFSQSSEGSFFFDDNLSDYLFGFVTFSPIKVTRQDFENFPSVDKWIVRHFDCKIWSKFAAWSSLEAAKTPSIQFWVLIREITVFKGFTYHYEQIVVLVYLIDSWSRNSNVDLQKFDKRS